MHDLQAITPLGASAPSEQRYGPVRLLEVVDIALASVAGRIGQEKAAQKLLARYINAMTPAPQKCAGEEIRAFWMGPDQWMVEAPMASHEDLASQLAAQSKGAVSVTEQTDAWCRFDLIGPDLSRIFELLCPVDTRRFAGGEAVRTSIDHLGCFVICRNKEHISVLGPRSAADSIHHSLQTAIRSAL